MTLSWFAIVRLGLVQMALGAIVVLTTSTLNRLMVVELSLPTVLPGLLVGLHYGIQVTRPNWGFLSDRGGRRTRWIVGGMFALAAGALISAAAIPLFEASFLMGMLLSVLGYSLIGLGVGASGTSLLALLATATEKRRRPAAATITWLMMIFGIAVTAGTVGVFLDPYSHSLLLKIVAFVAGGAILMTVLAVWGVERGLVVVHDSQPMRFREGLAEIWSETSARHFTVFVFLSMTAYFMQELILEPYAGLVFGFTPGQSTSLSGVQNGGVFLGMLAVGIVATGFGFGSLRNWVIVGCLGSATALTIIAVIGQMSVPLLVPSVFTLGIFNGIFAIAAIGSMMALAGRGRAAREGTRMGLWGAAQAIAAGFGGLLGAAAVDVFRQMIETPAAFGVVFVFEASLFVASAMLAQKIMSTEAYVPGRAVVPGE